MDNSESFSESIVALSSFFVSDATFEETLKRVSDLACVAVPNADIVGLTMLVEGRPKTAVFTDDTAPVVDAAQYETGMGPCLDAFRSREPMRIDDTEKDEHWAAFSEAAAAHGLRSVLSLPVVADSEGMGALNLYSRTPDAFTPEHEKLAGVFAAQAGIVLANSRAYWNAYELSQQLKQAMASRATIEQAKGVLMGAQRCDPEEAFQILVQASQRENRKLREIAEHVVRSTAARRRGEAPHTP